MTSACSNCGADLRVCQDCELYLNRSKGDKNLNLFVAKLERKIREDLTIHYPDDETDEMICISCKDLISFVDDVFHDFLKEEVE